MPDWAERRRAGRGRYKFSQPTEPQNMANSCMLPLLMVHRPGNLFSQARLADINLYTTRRARRQARTQKASQGIDLRGMRQGAVPETSSTDSTGARAAGHIVYTYGTERLGPGSAQASTSCDLHCPVVEWAFRLLRRSVGLGRRCG